MFADRPPLLNWAVTGGAWWDMWLHENDARPWRTPVVVVPSAYDELTADTPGYLLHLLDSPRASLYMYQRLEPDSARYAHNVGYETGLYLRFVVDHYDDLPEVVVMVHGIPDAHNPDWLRWVGCLRPNMTFTSLNTEWVDRAVQGDAAVESFEPYQLWVEQCMRDVIELATGAPHPPGARIPLRTYCCAQFAVHSSVIRRRPKAVWQELYARFGEPPGVCHRGAPRPLEELVSAPLAASQQPWGGPEVNDGKLHGKVVLGLTMEHLTGLVWGNESHDMPGPYGADHYCAQFFPDDVCPGSPCRVGPPQGKGRRLRREAG
jgi:hypothetical protein